jgi:hypothetical protein
MHWAAVAGLLRRDVCLDRNRVACKTAGTVLSECWYGHGAHSHCRTCMCCGAAKDMLHTLTHHTFVGTSESVLVCVFAFFLMLCSSQAVPMMWQCTAMALSTTILTLHTLMQPR